MFRSITGFFPVALATLVTVVFLLPRNVSADALNSEEPRPVSRAGNALHHGWLESDTGNRFPITAGILHRRIMVFEDDVALTHSSLSLSNPQSGAGPADASPVAISAPSGQPILLQKEQIFGHNLAPYSMDYRYSTDRFKITVLADGVRNRAGPIAAHGLVDADRWRCSCRYDDYGQGVKISDLFATVEWQSGDFSFRSLTSSRSPTDALSGSVPHIQRSDGALSEELRMVSNWKGDFNVAFGLHILSEDIDFPFSYFGDLKLTANTSSSALFGEATYDPFGPLRLTFGLRSTREIRGFSGSGTASLAKERARDRNSNKATRRLELNYDFHHSSIHLSRSSGFSDSARLSDDSAPAALFSVDDEAVTTEELGYRGQLAAGRLSVSATYFSSDYDRLQLNSITAAGFADFSLPGAEISGLQVSLMASLAPGLQLHAGMLSQETELIPQDGIVARGLAPLAESGNTARVAKGLPLPSNWMPQTPKSSLSMELLYRAQTRNELHFYLSGELTAGAAGYPNPHDPHDDLATFFNLQVGIGRPGLWDSTFWVRNTVDQRSHPVLAFANSFSASDRVVWGVDFDYRF